MCLSLKPDCCSVGQDLLLASWYHALVLSVTLRTSCQREIRDLRIKPSRPEWVLQQLQTFQNIFVLCPVLAQSQSELVIKFIYLGKNIFLTEEPQIEIF